METSGFGRFGGWEVAMAAGRLVQHNLTEFFRDLLRDAMRRSAVQSTEETEFYLVKLLYVLKC